MSNSAFTPTQIEVTNEVPVNVPVVTGWENYTPTISPISGYATNPHGQWRRFGDSMEVRISFKKNTSAGTGGALLFGLPTGYNIDITKCATEATDQPAFGIANGFNIVTTNQYDRSLTVMYIAGNTTQVGVINPGTSQFITGSSVLANAEFNLEFRVPISQWSGSGTTTLATRAVEEYAWNSSTSTLDDSTSFAYGPSGVTFKAFAPTGVNYVYRRVRFQTAIQATDSILLEINDGTTNNWLPAASAFYPYQQNDAGTTNYGIAVTRVGGSSTDVDVRFFSQATKTSGDTWSANSTWKWRLRKVSSGAQIGYPVSARNIVGDTSGSVVPTGMLGEVIENNVNSANVTTTIASVVSITLTPGVWDIGATVGINTSSNANGWCLIGVSTSSSAVTGSQGKNFTYTGSISSIGFTTSATLTPSRVVVTANTPYYAVVQANTNMNSAAHVYIRAIRIA